ncbi:DUF5085 family protein [Staphylococcus pettenkoferi]|uniref:DUF5085 family protein n=1 Tax=Staphylococcus pettenkoferi TaxID=170573 RepID=UPI00066DC632|nr:DUF5085 family protein [Staphylococcus pettenkoferi]MDK7115192.1 DUF5085 family protein [Staphylococcus pettenkoferi]MDK7283145.1 DUF5085 family protein [Staphylococcus pettenkoferi]
MELNILLVPYCAKVEIVTKEEEWYDELISIKEFFISEDVYTMGPVVFTKEVVGLEGVKYVVYIPLNAPIEPIPELSIEYQPLLEVYPTLSHKCLDDEDIEAVYQSIEEYALTNDIQLAERDYYHVMLEYAGGLVFEIHAEIDVDGVEGT